ncbi:MAG: hypothetical protein R3345_09640, partial [Fulvivirga sp.]|nr:hypothetical protein [Fulvivirga sp.]
PDISPEVAYLKHLQLSLDYFLNESPQALEKLEEDEEELITLIQQNATDPIRNFYLAEIKLRSSFTHLKSGNELSAVWNLRQAFRLIEKNTQQHPGFLLNNKPLGLLHVLLGAVPDQHQWIIGLLGMEGDVDQGIVELNKVAESDNMLQLEAELMMAIIDSYLLNNTEEGASAMWKIQKSHPHSPLINHLLVGVLLKNAQAQKAADILMQNPADDNPLYYYQKGNVHLQLGNYKLSEKSFLTFLTQYEGNNYIKDTFYKLYLAAWLQNEDSIAQKYREAGLKAGITRTEADKHAAKMLNSQHAFHKKLMKVRLFTDGGSYDQAETILKNNNISDFSRPEDQLEFLYRKARLKHKTDQHEQAITLYKEVIRRQKGNQYFAPNSCLQLGYIFLGRSDQEEARKYFEKALSYKHHEYENSIDNKAKAALKSLR